MSERKVYFKYYGKFPDASLLPHTHLRPDLNLAIEFTLLSALHKAAPNGIVRPLAMVKKEPIITLSGGLCNGVHRGQSPEVRWHRDICQKNRGRKAVLLDP